MPRTPIGKAPMTTSERLNRSTAKLKESGGARKTFRLDKASVRKLEALAVASNLSQTQVVMRLLATATKQNLKGA